MKNKKILIIGGGIAGLSAGSYLQRNGYNTEIFEAHNLPGGVCTAWKRGEYTFDYCIHWLMGTNESSGFHTIWEELGALEDEEGKKTQIQNFEKFTSVELKNGEVVPLYADLNKLEQEFLKLAPEDEKNIRKFIKDLKKLADFKEGVVNDQGSIIDKISFWFKNTIPFLKLIKYVRMSMEELSEKWENPQLKEIFSCVIPSSWSALSLLLGLAKQHVQAAGYPIGGSLPFVRNIERKYLKLGGEINYSSKVEKILVKNDQAIGIRLENGEEYYGDEIISAADGHTTLFKMLEGEYLSSKLEKAYEEFSLFPSSIHLGFGVNKDLSELPHSMLLNFSDPLILPDGSEHEYINLMVYHFDPTLAPEGKTPVTVLLNTWKDEYWQELAEEVPERYKKEKKRIGEDVLNILEERFPGFSEAVEQIDISTPHTVKRYTNNWHGSYEGFAPTPEALMTKLPKEIPGLDNCYMIGQWTEPGGGIPSAALNGRNITRKLCKKDNKEFFSNSLVPKFDLPRRSQRTPREDV